MKNEGKEKKKKKDDVEATAEISDASGQSRRRIHPPWMTLETLV